MSAMTLPDGREFGTGDRIRVHGFIAAPEGSYSIAGFQPKLVGEFYDVTGTVRHVKGNHPNRPTRIWIFFDDDIELGDMSGPILTMPCNKHPGVEEPVLEWHPAFQIEIINPA